MKSDTNQARNAAGKKAMSKPTHAAGGPKKAERAQGRIKGSGVNKPVTVHTAEMDLPTKRKTPNQHQKL
jgi:hypothetical protein